MQTKQSLFGQLLDIVIIFLSLIQVVIFIVINLEGPGKGPINWVEPYSRYPERANWGDPYLEQEPTWVRQVEIGFGFFFTVEYLIRLSVARDRTRHFFSIFPLVDLVTVLPIWIEIIILQLDLSKRSDSLATTFRPIRVLRALRIFRAYRLLQFSKSRLQRQVFLLVFSAISIIICVAGIFQTLEACLVTEDQFLTGECQDLGFIDAIYFIVSSITTVG